MNLVFKKDNLHKYLALIFLAFFFILLLSTDCFATTVDVKADGLDTLHIDLPSFIDEENYNYLTFYNYINSDSLVFYLWFTKGNFFIDDSVNNNTQFVVTSNTDLYMWYTSGFVKDRQLGETFVQGIPNQVPNIIFSENFKVINNNKTYNNDLISTVDSNVTIHDGQGNVVFQIAPQEAGAGLILPPIATSWDFSQVLQEILALLPMILLVVILLLSLRKAIQILFQTLRQS